MNYKWVLLILVYQETDQDHGTCCFSPHCVFPAPAALMAIAWRSLPAAAGSGAAAAAAWLRCGGMLGSVAVGVLAGAFTASASCGLQSLLLLTPVYTGVWRQPDFWQCTDVTH